MQGKNAEKKTVKSNDEAQKLKKRYKLLAGRLAKPGFLLQGNIAERTITRDNPRDPGNPKTIGPYNQWTFKRNAKTVTVNLSASQVKIFQKAIDNNRAIEALLMEMRELSREILDATTEGVRKRKRNT
jgi:hypothetical protein